MIWLNVLIPVIGCIVLLFFMKKISWWEYLILFISPLIINPIATAISVNGKMKDVEVINTYATNATYHEYWESWVDKTCSREVADGTETYRDSDGKTHTRTKYKTEYYDCSYCDENSPHWELNLASGKSIGYDAPQYASAKKKWGNETFDDQNRDIDFDHGCGKDGDVYHTSWNKVEDSMITFAETESYKNPLGAYGGVFSYDTVSTEEVKGYGLFEYPSVSSFDYNPILGAIDPVASKKLRQWNALNGYSKQAHVLICVFRDKPQKAGLLQEAYWKGGNKNEFVLCVGVDKANNIQWTHVFSWTEQMTLKATVKNTVLTMGYDMPKIVEYTTGQVKKFFIRKQFKDFDYIKVPPSTTATIWASIFILLITIGLCIFAVKNDYTLFKWKD